MNYMRANLVYFLLHLIVLLLDVSYWYNMLNGLLERHRLSLIFVLRIFLTELPFVIYFIGSFSSQILSTSVFYHDAGL